MDHYYYTEKGYERLKEEIEKLDRYIKQDISKEIAAAREHGDLKENAEYDAAKEKQAFHMVKLGQLRDRLANARIIRREEMPEDTVTLGKRVKVREVASGDEKEYTILGDGETDVDKGIISYQSPLAQALINQRQGEVVDVRLPRGLKQLEIIDIAFFEED